MKSSCERTRLALAGLTDTAGGNVGMASLSRAAYGLGLRYLVVKVTYAR